MNSFSAVQSNGATGDQVTSVNVTLSTGASGANVTPGNGIVLVVGWNRKDISLSGTPLTSDQSDSFAQIGTTREHTSTPGGCVAIFLVTSAVGGATVFTAHFTGSARTSLNVLEFSYSGAPTYESNQVDAEGTSNPGPNPTAVTPADNGSVLVIAGWGSDGADQVVNSNLTVFGVTASAYGGAAYSIVSGQASSAQTTAFGNFTFTNRKWAAAAVTFKEASAGQLPIPVAMHHYEQQEGF